MLFFTREELSKIKSELEKKAEKEDKKASKDFEKKNITRGLIWKYRKWKN